MHKFFKVTAYEFAWLRQFSKLLLVDFDYYEWLFYHFQDP